jgi:hypothetical protein
MLPLLDTGSPKLTMGIAATIPVETLERYGGVNIMATSAELNPHSPPMSSHDPPASLLVDHAIAKSPVDP